MSAGGSLDERSALSTQRAWLPISLSALPTRQSRKTRKVSKPPYKPGSGSCLSAGDGHSSRPAVTSRLERAYPEVSGRAAPALLTEGASLFALASGGVWLAAPVTRGAVRSYRTLSPLPRRPGRFAFCGTIPRVTPAGRYPAPCIHGARTFLRPRGQRPSGRLALNGLGIATAKVKERGPPRPQLTRMIGGTRRRGRPAEPPPAGLSSRRRRRRWRRWSAPWSNRPCWRGSCGWRSGRSDSA